MSLLVADVGRAMLSKIIDEWQSKEIGIAERASRLFFFFVCTHVLLIKCLSSSDIISDENRMVYHRGDVGKFHLSLGDVILKSLSPI